MVVRQNTSTKFHNPAWWVPEVWGEGAMRAFIKAETAACDRSAMLTHVLAAALVNERDVLYAYGDRSNPYDTTAETLGRAARTSKGHARLERMHG